MLQLTQGKKPPHSANRKQHQAQSYLITAPHHPACNSVLMVECAVGNNRAWASHVYCFVLPSRPAAAPTWALALVPAPLHQAVAATHFAAPLDDNALAKLPGTWG